MHICFVSINYWPEDTGIAAFNVWRAEFLASRGHEVTVCTGFPYYPAWKIAEDYRGKVWQQEEHNGVRILRSWLWVPEKVTSKARILHEASFITSSLLRTMSAKRPDLFYVISPPLGLGATATVLQKLRGVPYAFDVEDLQPDAAAELGMLRNQRLLKFLYGVERMAYNNAALVTTLTEGVRARILAKGIAPEKVVLAPIRASAEYLQVGRTHTGQAFRKKYGLEGKFTVVHSGNMGVKQGLGVILRTANRCRDLADVEFLIVGDGADRRNLEAQAERMQLRNLRFVPLLPEEEFLDMLGAVDLALITQLRTVSDIAFPSKTATLLSSGCPVVASVSSSSEVSRVVSESGGGVVTEPENDAELEREVRRLHSDDATRRTMSETGRAYAVRRWHDRENLLEFERNLMRAAGKLQ